MAKSIVASLMPKLAIILLAIPVLAAIAASAAASDTGRLADCIAVADAARAAAKNRDAGVSREKTIDIIDRQQTSDDQKDQVNPAVADVYSDHSLTPDQASAREFQSCFESE
jgi:hypothetical protein